MKAPNRRRVLIVAFITVTLFDATAIIVFLRDSFIIQAAITAILWLNVVVWFAGMRSCWNLKGE